MFVMMKRITGCMKLCWVLCSRRCPRRQNRKQNSKISQKQLSPLSGMRGGLFCIKIWSGQRDSNPRPSAWEANALPTELCPLNRVLKTNMRCFRQAKSFYSSFTNCSSAIMDLNLSLASFNDLAGVSFPRMAFSKKPFSSGRALNQAGICGSNTASSS